MIKTLTIDGQKVTFKSTGATAKLYKAQFGTDFMQDVLAMAPLMSHVKQGEEGEELDIKEIPYDALKTIDFDVFSNILWVLAKTADRRIEDPITWLDQFEEFPVFDLFEEVQDLLLNNFTQSKKKKAVPPDRANR